MNKRYCSSLRVTWALKNLSNADLAVLFKDHRGLPLPATQARDILEQKAALGHEVMLLSTCDNFDPAGAGCLGHEVQEGRGMIQSSATPSRPALRYHGGKFRIAQWVMSFFPEHTCYVEPFGGAAGVLLQKPRAYAEVYNDLDGEVVNFFRVLRDPCMREELIEACMLTPYSRDEFDLSWEPTDNPVEMARRLAVRAQMGFGSAGATKGVTGFRIDTSREYGTAQQLWAYYPHSLAAVGKRLSSVLIENRPAIEVMFQHDSPQTLHFVDPPYVHSTRVRASAGGKMRYYRHEMTDAEHIQLIECLRGLKGMVCLSGYPSELYDSRLSDWERHTTTARISAGRGGAVRTEVIWLNAKCSQLKPQATLFHE